MSNKAKPYRTRHRELNDLALGKVNSSIDNIAELLQHIAHTAPRDTKAITLAGKIARQMLGAKDDLIEEQRILDNGGADVVAFEQTITKLMEACHFLQDENVRLANDMTVLMGRQDLLETALSSFGVRMELPVMHKKEAKK